MQIHKWRGRVGVWKFFKSLRADGHSVLQSEYIKVTSTNSDLKSVSDKNITNKSEIEIGIRDSGYVEVISGLKEGDIIVAEGLKKVRPNGKIKPILF